MLILNSELNLESMGFGAKALDFSTFQQRPQSDSSFQESNPTIISSMWYNQNSNGGGKAS